VTVTSSGPPVDEDGAPVPVPLGVDDIVVELTAVVEDELTVVVEDEITVVELVTLGGGTYTPASCTEKTHSKVPSSPAAGPLAVTSSSSRPLVDAP
jgi:hypothetical protein